MELIKAASFTLHSASYRFEVYTTLSLLFRTTCMHSTDISQHRKGMCCNSSSSQNCPMQGECLPYIHHSNPALLHVQGNLKKRYLMHSPTLPSDNTPQGTGRIQTHSSCTFSCKLLGLHLSGRRNEQVSPVAQSSKVPAAGTLREASCFQISLAPAQPSHKETEGRAQTAQELPPCRFCIKVNS